MKIDLNRSIFKDSAMKALNALKNERGQTAVEFIVVVVVVFFFLLFFLSLAFVLVLSQYMDYATFMAARTYKAAHGDPLNQQQKARAVFDQYVQPVLSTSLVKSVSPLVFIQATPGGREYFSEGVRATYTLNFFYLPPLFVTGRQPSSLITLTSENFLGRDPNYEECFSFFEAFTERFGIVMKSGGADLTSRMEDNGC